MMDMTIRPRRLRGCDSLRHMVRETRMSPDSLIYPIFVDEQLTGRRAIDALEGQYHYGLDSVCGAVRECVEAGVGRCILFGLPAKKDASGSSAWDRKGVVQQAIRAILDKNGHQNTPIMSYSAKYASAFYGPFREAAGSAPSFGDRKGYQMDPHNRKEAVKECALDVEEGADILMVKPALSYLDIIRECSDAFDLPMCAYSVSGEYAMTKAAAAAGLIDEYRVMCESAVSIFRAGADILITYYAKELSQAMRKGDIG